MTWRDLKEKMGGDILKCSYQDLKKEKYINIQTIRLKKRLLWEILQYADKGSDLLEQGNNKECRWIAEWRKNRIADEKKVYIKLAIR